jgi:hypothetical protein
MSYARYRLRPAHTPTILDRQSTRQMDASPRTNAHADQYRLVAVGHIRPFFWEFQYHYHFCCQHHPHSIAIVAIPRLLLPAARCIKVLNPSSFTRARASTSRAGHQLHPSCSHKNLKRLSPHCETPLRSRLLATLAPPTLHSVYPLPVASTPSLKLFFGFSLFCCVFSVFPSRLAYRLKFPSSLTLERRRPV